MATLQQYIEALLAANNGQPPTLPPAPIIPELATPPVGTPQGYGSQFGSAAAIPRPKPGTKTPKVQPVAKKEDDGFTFDDFKHYIGQALSAVPGINLVSDIGNIKYGGRTNMEWVGDIFGALGSGAKSAHVTELEEYKKSHGIAPGGSAESQYIPTFFKGLLTEPEAFAKGFSSSLANNNAETYSGSDVAEAAVGSDKWKDYGAFHKFMLSIVPELLEDPLLVAPIGRIGKGIKALAEGAGLETTAVREARILAERDAAQQANNLANQGNTMNPPPPGAAPNVPPQPGPQVPPGNVPPGAGPIPPGAGPSNVPPGAVPGNVPPGSTIPPAAPNIPPGGTNIPPGTTIPPGAPNIPPGATNIPPGAGAGAVPPGATNIPPVSGAGNVPPTFTPPVGRTTFAGLQQKARDLTAKADASLRRIVGGPDFGGTGHLKVDDYAGFDKLFKTRLQDDLLVDTPAQKALMDQLAKNTDEFGAEFSHTMDRQEFLDFLNNARGPKYSIPVYKTADMSDEPLKLTPKEFFGLAGGIPLRKGAEVLQPKKIWAEGQKAGRSINLGDVSTVHHHGMRGPTWWDDATRKTAEYISNPDRLVDDIRSGYINTARTMADKRLTNYHEALNKLAPSHNPANVNKAFQIGRDVVKAIEDKMTGLETLTTRDISETAVNINRGMSEALKHGAEAGFAEDVVTQQMHNVIAKEITDLQQDVLANLAKNPQPPLIQRNIEDFLDSLTDMAKDSIGHGQAARQAAQANRAADVIKVVEEGGDAGKAAEANAAAGTTDDLADAVKQTIHNTIPKNSLTPEDAEALVPELIGMVKMFKTTYHRQVNKFIKAGGRKARSYPYITAFDTANNIEKIKKSIFRTTTLGRTRSNHIPFSFAHRVAAVAKAAEVEQARLGREIALSRVTHSVGNKRFGPAGLADSTATPLADDFVEIPVGSKFNVPFSVGKLVEDLANHSSEKANYVFLGRRPKDYSKSGPKFKYGSASPFITQAVKLAAFKNKSAYDAFIKTASEGTSNAYAKEIADWLLKYDAKGNSQYAEALGQASRVSDTKAMDDLNETIHDAANSASTGGEAAHNAATAANAASTAAASGAVSPARAGTAQQVFNQTAQTASNRINFTPTGAGHATQTNAKNLGPTTAATSSAQNTATNHAAQKVSAGSGTPKYPPGQTVNPIPGASSGPHKVYQTDKGWWQRITESWIPARGMKLARPFKDSNTASARSIMAVSSRFWMDVKKLDPTDSFAVLKALGNPTLATNLTLKQAEMYKKIDVLMKDLFGSGDFVLAQQGTNTVNKVGLNIERLNIHLANSGARFGSKGTHTKPFQFDVTNPDLESQWRAALTNIKDPTEARDFIDALHDIEGATFSALAERITIDEIAEAFGSSTPVPGWINMKDAVYNNGDPLHLAKYLEGTWMRPDMAAEMGRLDFVLNEELGMGAHTFWREFDALQRQWKTGITIYNAHHHDRNFTGDLFLVQADGISISKWVPRAARIIKKTDWKNEMYRGLPISEIRNPQTYLKPRSMRPANVAKYGKAAKNKSTGIVFDADQARARFQYAGLQQSSGVIEDITSSSTTKVNQFLNRHSKFTQPLGGKGHRFVSMISEAREHTTRMAHFLGALEDVKIPKRLRNASTATKKEYIYRQAAFRAKKYHPDGLAMTKWERQVMARSIPFYSWQRKAIPLVLVTAIRRPVLTSAYPRLMGDLAESRDYDREEYSQDPSVASFLKNSFQAPIDYTPYQYEDGKVVGGGYTAVKGPSTPALDVGALFGGQGQYGDVGDTLVRAKNQWLGSTSPALRVPIETLFNTQASTGIPVNPEYSQHSGFYNYAKYFAEQVPGVSTITRYHENKLPLWADAINWLTAAGITQSGPFTKTAEFEEKEAAREGR